MQSSDSADPPPIDLGKFRDKKLVECMKACLGAADKSRTRQELIDELVDKKCLDEDDPSIGASNLLAWHFQVLLCECKCGIKRKSDDGSGGGASGAAGASLDMNPPTTSPKPGR